MRISPPDPVFAPEPATPPLEFERPPEPPFATIEVITCVPLATEQEPPLFPFAPAELLPPALIVTARVLLTVRPERYLMVAPPEPPPPPPVLAFAAPPPPPPAPITVTLTFTVGIVNVPEVVKACAFRPGAGKLSVAVEDADAIDRASGIQLVVRPDHRAIWNQPGGSQRHAHSRWRNLASAGRDLCRGSEIEDDRAVRKNVSLRILESNG